MSRFFTKLLSNQPVFEREFGAPWLFAFTFLVSIVLLYPGWMTLDSTSQLQQARTFVLNDGHPPSMAIIWSVMDKIVPGPLLMLILNILVHMLGLWLLMTPLAKRLSRRIAFFLIYFFPPTFLIIGSIWKDTLMNGFLLLSAGLIIAALVERRYGRRLRADLYALGCMAASFLAISFRHNAPAGAFPILALFGYYIFARQGWLGASIDVGETTTPGVKITIKNFFASALTGAVLAIILFGGARFTFDRFVTHKQHFWQVVAIHDIAAVSIKTGTVYFPRELYPDLTLPEIEKSFTEYMVLTTSKDPNLFQYRRSDTDLGYVSDAWKNVIFNEPGAYFSHRWTMFISALGLGKIHPWSPVIINPVPEARKYLSDTPVAQWQVNMRKSISKWAVRSEPLVYEGYFYLFFMLVMLAGVVINWIVAKRLTLLQLSAFILLLSGLGYQMSLFPATPSPDFRYSTYMIFTVLAAGMLFILCFNWRAAIARVRPRPTIKQQPDPT